eukprot:417406_1
MSRSNFYMRKFITLHGPIWHRLKQLGYGVACIGLFESTLLCYYFPNRPILEASSLTPFNENNDNNDLSLTQTFMIKDILSIYRDKPIGMYHSYFDRNIITEDAWFRWIGIGELSLHRRLVMSMIPNPILTNIKYEWKNVYDENNPYYFANDIVEQLILKFNSKIKNIQFDDNESYDITLIMDIDSNGLIKYQRQLYEGKQLITPNTNPMFGYLVRLIKRANSFWYRLGKAPATMNDI